MPNYLLGTTKLKRIFETNNTPAEHCSTSIQKTPLAIKRKTKKWEFI